MKKFLLYLGVVVGVVLNIIALGVGAKVWASEVDDFAVPEAYIKAVNPGYNVDGINNVGEMIEIGRNSDEPILLAGLVIGYTNSSGNETVLVEFPENSWLVGESILLRLASSPGHELAALGYTKTLAFKAGPLVIRRGDELIDSVCWTGKDGCVAEFKSASPTTLVRNLETGEFEHIAGYEPIYAADNYLVENEEDGKGGGESQCAKLMFSEVLSYYDDSQAEQFVEFYNDGMEQILLDGCQIKYKNKYYPLSGILKPEGYVARYLDDFSITKNPATSNILELVDVNGEVVDKLEYPNGQKKGTSYAMIGYGEDGKEIWRTTFAPTPGEPNNYQEHKTCESGKVINKTTGNCVKVTVVEEKVCPAGQYLNPLTNRCRKIVAETVKTCKEGYYLNEETGRCRKIAENTGADYSLVTETYEEQSSFVALYAVLGVAGLGVIYVIYEFRREIGRLFGKVFRRFR